MKWFSPALNREMELLVFGDKGSPVILFPTRMARFYDYEDWGVIDALADKIDAGLIQVFCLDSVDAQSFYCKNISPGERIQRHACYEQYLLHELVPFIQARNQQAGMVSAGCSLGAYHAVNFAFRYPHLFIKIIGMSGRYDLTLRYPYFEDLFEGYRDEFIYNNMPTQYIHHLSNTVIHQAIQQLVIVLAIGREDVFYENNCQLANSLSLQNIPHVLHVMNGEAHKARYWGEVLNQYL